jgi:hypothetical protein
VRLLALLPDRLAVSGKTLDVEKREANDSEENTDLKCKDRTVSNLWNDNYGTSPSNELSHRMRTSCPVLPSLAIWT